MNVVGASETVVPHAVAEGYQRTKRYAKISADKKIRKNISGQKDKQKDMTGKSFELSSVLVTASNR